MSLFHRRPREYYQVTFIRQIPEDMVLSTRASREQERALDDLAQEQFVLLNWALRAAKLRPRNLVASVMPLGVRATARVRLAGPAAMAGLRRRLDEIVPAQAGVSIAIERYITA